MFYRKLDRSELKMYPGSAQGPDPSDNPSHYIEWFLENQPSQFSSGDEETDLRMAGIKIKQNTAHVETNQDLNFSSIDYIKTADEEYRYQTLQPHDIPQYEGLQKMENASSSPVITISSPLRAGEMGLAPPDMNISYHHAQAEIEKWGVFRLMPQIVNFQKRFGEFQFLLDLNLIRRQDDSRPSLFTYFHTLPKWCRDNPVVRNVLMGLEYTKPLINFRQKELALNFACSMILPIDESLFYSLLSS
jgi:hypothetical protein